MSNGPARTGPFADDGDQPDSSGAGWQPLLDKPGFEQWWDGTQWRGRPRREPDPFSAFTPDLTRSLRPGPNRAAHVARVGIAFIVLSFVAQAFVATATIRLDGVEQIVLTLFTLAVAAVVAAGTAIAAVLALRAAPQLGGRAIATLALGVSIILGLAPVLLLTAIGLAGGV